MDKVHVLCVKFKFINVFLSSEFLFIKFLLTSILDYQNNTARIMLSQVNKSSGAKSNEKLSQTNPVVDCS